MPPYRSRCAYSPALIRVSRTLPRELPQEGKSKPRLPCPVCVPVHVTALAQRRCVGSLRLRSVL